jgi:hypothetical protein
MRGVHEFVTPAVIEESDVQQPDSLVFLAIDLDESVRTDPNTFVSMRVLASRDDGKTWQPICGATFRGDPDLLSTAPIGVGVSAAAMVGARIKSEIDSPETKAVGLSVQVRSSADFGGA